MERLAVPELGAHGEVVLRARGLTRVFRAGEVDSGAARSLASLKVEVDSSPPTLYAPARAGLDPLGRMCEWNSGETAVAHLELRHILISHKLVIE